MSWLIIGLSVNIHYLIKNHKKYGKALDEGELSWYQLLLGVTLTLFMWPITIFNQEYRL